MIYSWNAPESLPLSMVSDSYITPIRKVLGIGEARPRQTGFERGSRRQAFIATFKSCRRGFTNKIFGLTDCFTFFGKADRGGPKIVTTDVLAEANHAKRLAALYDSKEVLL